MTLSLIIIGYVIILSIILLFFHGCKVNNERYDNCKLDTNNKNKDDEI